MNKNVRRERFIRREKFFRKDQMRKGIYILPNLFTTASLFAGIYAIIASIQGNFIHAAVAIPISLILDGLDGRIARMTHTTSRFGVEYDSLSDLVAFGVAPSVLAYTWSLSAFGKWGWLAAALFTTCGALRLARFNVQIGVIDSRYFNGLAIPAAAIVVSSTVMLYDYLGGEGTFPHMAILVGMIVLSLLMVSSIKFYSFKDLHFLSREPFMTVVLAVILMIIVLAEPQVMIFTFAVSYAASGPIWWVLRMVRRLFGPAKGDQPTGAGEIKTETKSGSLP
ncbi:MAG: CDP-diacylglycerol--serine O-phosphatidyltransferase [Syntrophaceae bacterium]|nr:CDP-diacylglycerol--serine O-phosphatidyltransferase [Syntrophaceae bacterium]